MTLIKNNVIAQRPKSHGWLSSLFLVLGTWFLCLGAFPAQPPVSSGEQSRTIDSLQSLLKQNIADTTRINTLNALGRELVYSNPDTAILLSTQALALSEKTKWKKGIADSHHKLGWFANLKGNYPLSLSHNFKALEIRKRLNDKKNIASSFGNIGVVYKQQGDYPAALKYYFGALEIAKNLRNKESTATILGSVGLVYAEQGNYPAALKHYFDALKIDKELGNKNGIASQLGNIGLVYAGQADYHNALKHFFEALEIGKELGDKNRVAIQLGNIGVVYYEQGNYPAAMKYYLQALEIKEELGDKKGIAIWLGNIGEIYTKTGRFTEAEQYLDSTLKICNSIGALNYTMRFEKIISQLYDTLGQSSVGTHQSARRWEYYKLAYEHYKKYSAAKDSVFNEEKSKEIGKLEAGHEYETQILKQQKEHEKQQALAAEQLKRQKIIGYAVTGGFGLVLILAFVLFRSYRQKQKANALLHDKNRIIEEKNKDITDSIRYAENIQHAILTPIKEIKKVLPESFVLFNPKDIVSGDFYFFANIHTPRPPLDRGGVPTRGFPPLKRGGQGVCNENGLIVLAVCDCTGHGVPGAFMSMIGSQLLNEIVNDKSVTDAAEILNQLKKGIIHAFGEAGATGGQKDGMDMALCVFNLKTNQLQYAGANNPLYILRNPPRVVGAGLEVINPDKQPVGYTAGEQKPFTNHDIQLNKGDTIYMSSDGYQDQFGGPEGKKFMKKRLRQLFSDFREISMEEQEKHLGKTIEVWKGNGEQVDDILVIGVRV